MNDFITIGAAASPVLSLGLTGKAADARRTVPPVHKVKGTSLPVAGAGAFFGAVGAVMAADQVQGTGVDRIPAVADPGIPPRWRPVRC